MPEGAASLITDTVAFSLRDLVQNIGVIPIKCIQMISVQLLKAFQIIQSENKQYEGLQSSQILVTKNGEILLNFGIKQKILKNNISSSQQFTTFLNGQNEKELQNQLLSKNKNQDIYDLGFILLQCAIGDEEILQNSINELTACKIQVRCCLFHKLVSNCKVIELLSWRFPLEFNDFLCKCLAFNDDAKDEKIIEQLLSHDFLQYKDFSSEPQVELQDLIRITLGYNQNSVNFASEKQLDRIIEAIGVVVGKLEISANQQGYFNKRLSDLSHELALPIESVSNKLKSIVKLKQ